MWGGLNIEWKVWGLYIQVYWYNEEQPLDFLFISLLKRWERWMAILFLTIALNFPGILYSCTLHHGTDRIRLSYLAKQYSWICYWLFSSCFFHRSKGNEELSTSAHLFFYLADEDGNALNIGGDTLGIHENSLLASGSRMDIGSWQLHLKSLVMLWWR